jgi:zinc and cadmium transporter
MREARWPRGRIYATLGLAGALYPVGALLAGLLPEGFLPAALAFIAGDFLYIGAGDLLPEAHRRFNVKVIAAVFLGVGLMLLLKLALPGH